MSALQRISSFRSNLFLIPEMVSHIASFLTHPDLRSTVQVSRDWNLAFSPHLWETIDDRLYAWPRILGEKESTPDIVQTERWIQSAFAKHYIHIRHLHIRSTILVNAAARVIDNSSSSRNSWNLKSLSLEDDMKSVSTNAEIPIDNPHVMKQVTALIRVNTPTLLTLTIGDTYIPVCNTYCHALFTSLCGLYNMVEFNCGDGFEFRLTDVATFWPRLAHLRTWISSNGSRLKMSRSVPSLRSLVIRNPIYLQNVVDILNNLPGLEHLEVAHIFDTYDPVQIQQTMNRTNPPRAFKSLSIQETKDNQEETLNILFAWLPHLTTLTVHDVGLKAVKAIATHLPQLEVFIDTRKPAFIYPSRSIAANCTTLGLVLQSCPNLRVFDALGHRFSHWQMMTPWACTKLETLRCQIQCLRRLHVQEELAYSRARVHQEQGRRLNAKRARVFELHQASLDDHAHVYNQLARLTRLRVVELGFDDRQQWYYGDDSRICSRRFMRYSKPRDGTPAFSLEYGLGLLSGLKDLEVFGFEGTDHRIGEEELEWMAESWPRLRVLRGLEEDTLPRIQFDEHKARLRRHLYQIRPEVQHESLGAFGLRK